MKSTPRLCYLALVVVGLSAGVLGWRAWACDPPDCGIDFPGAGTTNLYCVGWALPAFSATCTSYDNPDCTGVTANASIKDIIGVGA
jgi:hypothetical protein